LVCGFACLFAMGWLTSDAHAQCCYPPPCYYPPPCCCPPPYWNGCGCPPGARMAPDMCGSSFYTTNNGCMWYGPGYCVRPPFEPFNGCLPECAKGEKGVPML